MVVGEASIHNIMGGMESTGGVRLHNHKRKLKQRFDIIKKLGQGTYGKVQLGINKETGQEVAIKTIKKCKIETEADLIRIRREIQIMSSVQHPNIIHIYEVFENREKMVLVMEYAAGGELYDYLSERKVLTEEEARRIFRQISIAVFYCHKHKICHRDLKLENILLDQTGNAKIADFGLSNVFDDQRLLNTFCGSPLYASPEIVKGTPYHGPEVDCWSLGVLLYTLVYGAMPFDGSNFKRLTRQISASDYFEPKTPSPASPLIKEMLTKCPSRRADIERICSHWWVNAGYEQNCLDIAEDLAAQTPVRLDLLLSLVPQSASADKLVVGDPRPEPSPVSNMSSETIVPTRCHSVGSLMELDRNDDKLRDMVEGMEEETRNAGDTKRKLETTPSMEETVATGVKRKERSRRKEKSGDEREQRAYRSSSRHHSAPIGAAITEEPMEVDLRDPESADALLEMIKEVQSQTPKERSKTPVAPDQAESAVSEVTEEARATKQAAEASPKSPRITKAQTPHGEAGVDENALAQAKEDEGAKALEDEVKKPRPKSASIDLEEAPVVGPAKPTERRRSKIFETAEKFNQLAASPSEQEKPKKIFIPGVNVGGAKKVFERKASLSSITPPAVKQNATKVIIDVDKKPERALEKSVSLIDKTDDERKKEEDKKRAVDIISGALGKPPIKKNVNGSPPITPQDSKKLGLKIQIAPNDVRNATISVTTPVETKYPEFEAISGKPVEIGQSVPTSPEAKSLENSVVEPTMSSKIEITLKSATLPRPRKTSKAEIILSGIKQPETAFKSEVEAKIDAFHPQKLRTQRSEVAFPVASAVQQQGNRSSSLEPENRRTKERIIPIQVEPEHQSPPPHAKPPPMPQRSLSQRSGSLSRQSTADSDTDSALGSTVGPEPIRKSPREYIIPIAVEGGGYVTPRSGSLEPESKTSTPTSTNPTRSRFSRPRRMGSLLSDASEDESPFSTLHRDSDDLLQRHMHRLRSSRPSKQTPEHADSLSSGEDDDDDGFELLTAENLFSTLLSRVRSLTQRLNVDDHRGSGFPRTRLLDRLGSKSSQGFWGLHEPLSRRISESPFSSRSMSRDTDRFGRKDSAMSSNPGTPNSLGRSTPSRESIFEVGSSNTLPRATVRVTLRRRADDKSNRDTSELELKMIAESQGEPQNQDKTFTPCLARRLSRQFIEQTRLSLPRSPSIPRERLYRSSTEEPMSRTDPLTSPILPESYRSRSSDRSLRRATSLLEPQEKPEKIDHRAARRSVSLFEDDDELLPPLPRQIMTLGRKYRDPVKSASNGIRRESFRAEKIQEEPVDVNSPKRGNNLEVNIDTLSTSENTSACNSNTNLGDMSSFSTKSCETSPADSTSNMQGEAFNSFKADAREFENRLLAAENLIKESKLRNLGINRFDPNLSSSYKDTDKCDKELLGSMSDLTSAVMSKRRSCIPSLRLRSGSLTREASGGERRRTLEDGRAATPERSLLSKFFRSSSSTRDSESKEKSPKARRRISRFLRPDFFDTPREESQYVKEKEAQKAAENERRKSRFMRKKVEPQENSEENGKDEKQEKELKNEANTLTKEKIEEKQSFDGKDNKIENDGSLGSNSEGKFVRQSSKNSFLQSLEKKLEKLRSNDEAKVIINGDSGKQNSVVAPEDLQERQDSAENLRKVLSEENLSVSEVQSAPAAPTPKSKVSSVLGLFKNDSKSSLNGNKQPNTLLSKFKKNSYKGSRSDTSVMIGEASGSSKIPTKSKLESKVDSKVPKKVSETKKSLDKGAEAKKSPSKEKSKEKSPPKEKTKEKTPSERSSVEKKSSSEKSVMKSLKKLSPEKSTDGKSDKLIKELRKSGTPEKSDKCSFVSRLSPKKISPDKTLDTNKKAEVKLPESEEKKVAKKKAVKSLTSPLTKNGSISKLEKTDDDRKIRRIIVKQEIVEREGPDGTKKKKIVRVVKKVVKKSESAENKTEEKDKDKEKTKPMRPLSLKKITLKKEKSPESASKNEESSPEAPKLTKKSVSNSAEIVENCKGKPDKNFEILEGAAASENPIILPRKSPEKQKTEACADASSLPPPEDPKSRDSDEKFRANRCNLKLDLSKIPQHTFKPPPVPKRESPKPEASKLQSPGLDSISRMTHHANITGNRIVIDKALKSSDLVELKEETELKQVAKFSVNSTQVPQPKEKEHQPESKPPAIPAVPVKPKITPDPPEEILSPMEDLESFDSWSMCSNDFNHRCSSELQSPTSPAYSPSSRSDHPESIIDRIRRKSFYSRFNERKRKSSLNVSSSGISSISPLPISSTLPRKFSFNSTKDIDRRKPTYSTSPTRRLSERPFSMYHDDHLGFRKSPIERDRYSDVGYTGDYDLRKYRISPTPEAHRKYQSSDFNYDHDLGTYKSPLSSSSLSEPVSDYRGHAMTLPRKYGSLSSSEPKTAEYYEELLAPARLDYLTRRTPVPGDYVGKHENGYSNGHVDIAGAGDKWRSFSERIPGVDSTDESDKSTGDDIRGNSRARTEAKELSAACPDAEATNAINE